MPLSHAPRRATIDPFPGMKETVLALSWSASSLSWACENRLSPQSDCFISQYFAAGHILETKILVNCIGSFRNNTQYGRDGAEVRTLCDGQFEQNQEMRVYKPVESGSSEGETMMTFGMTDTFHSAYSCRHKFFLSRKLQTKSSQEPYLLSGRVQMSCEYEQSIRIQKGLCTCADSEHNCRLSNRFPSWFGMFAESCASANHKVFNWTAKTNKSKVAKKCPDE